MTKRNARLRDAIDDIITIASETDPDGVDAALTETAWDIAAIVSQRHGYGYIVVLEAGVAGEVPVCALGDTIPAAIRKANALVEARR